MKTMNMLLPLAAAIALSACGGSDGGNSNYPDAYLQFYNASPNSAETELLLDDVSKGSASYGDATSLLTLDAEQMDLTLQRTDADNKVIEILSKSIETSSGHKSLYLLLGDYDAPTLLEHKYERQSLDNHFILNGLSAIEGQSYDLYVAESGAPFEDAHLVSTLDFANVSEAEYWDGDTDSSDWDLDEYVIYLTAPGETEVVYESDSINFIYATEYTLVVRSTAGAVKNNLVVDLVINSTSIPSYKDVRAGAQYRYYNSLKEEGSVDARLSGTDVQQDMAVGAGQLSSYGLVKYGDYQLSASASDANMAFANKLLTLNQGESKTVVFYRNKEDKLSSLAFLDSDLPQVYEHEINAVNLVKDYDEIEIYFVRQDETVETAEFKLTRLEFAESDDLVLPSDYYEIIALYDDNSGNETLLYRTQAMAINEETSYVVVVEPDSSSASGYKVSLMSETVEE
ncbi:DUF4397 domain-containing protein [Aliiglaciecola sp. CAU 1673]|uniref:DUF4397 domain-containing protein n=1 Tax=Aliiglaciecola sp. CAU 1673 TaxID=3032595 RepID=UPI0023DBCC6D|nr:DUF4397 domain-containing protein [Aliiglaciecola sp. CAU 1673]MDF2177766.1 DUF4397 domain-containing protein [Aliiglaciecola sp. CAU 1673]